MILMKKWGGKGSARDSAPARGPPEIFLVLYPLRSFLVCFQTQFCIQFYLFKQKIIRLT